MIIVTGGAGFIGSNIIKGLNDHGVSDILVVDNLERADKHLNLNRLKFLDFVDKRDFDFASFLSNESVDAVFHQGACSDTVESNGRYMMKNNYEYSKQFLDASIDNNVKFIYASSASTYGNGTDGFKENSECEYPLNIYAYSKFLFDQYVRKVLSTGVPTQIVGLRYFNVYGEQENHKGRMSSLVFKLFNQAKAGNDLEIFEGSENFLRDFIYVKDIVDMNLYLLNKEDSGIFNAGTGKARSFYDIAKIVSEHFSKKIKNIPFPDDLKDKYQKFTEADMSKFIATGYSKPFTSLEDGIKSYISNLEKSNGYIL